MASWVRSLSIAGSVFRRCPARAARAAEKEAARRATREGSSPEHALAPQPRALGFDDGLIIPPDEFPAGTPSAHIRAAAAERAPLRGAVPGRRGPGRLLRQEDARDHGPLRGPLLLDRGAAPRQRQGVLRRGHQRPGRHHGRRRRPLPDAAHAHLVRQRQLRDQPAAGRRRDDAGSRPGPRRGGRGRPDRQLRALRQRRQRVRRRLHRGARRHAAARRPATPATSGRTSGPCRASYATDGDQDLRLPHDPRGRQDRRLRPRARPPAVRLPGPL